MANQPDENTVATSFTLPRQLFAAVKRKAKSELTNQSDIVRRALMNYLPLDERRAVLKEIGESGVDFERTKPVKYKISRPSSASDAVGSRLLKKGAASVPRPASK